MSEQGSLAPSDETLDALTGVVEPELPGMPQAEEKPTYLQVFGAASGAVQAALESVRSTLVHLRRERERINTDIRTLVEEESRLASMARIASKKVAE